MSTLQPSGLCSTCETVIKAGPGPVDEGYIPFKTVRDLLDAADLGCYICWTITHTKRWIDSPPETFQQGLEYTITTNERRGHFLESERAVMGSGSKIINFLYSPFRQLFQLSSRPKLDRIFASAIRHIFQNQTVEFRRLTVQGGKSSETSNATHSWTFRRPDPTVMVSPDIPPPRSASGDQEPIFSLQRHRWNGVGQVAMEFITSCVENHPSCQPHDSLYRPTRLLQILDNQMVRLISTSQTATGSYAALSHCWGQTQTIKLQSDTREQLERGIDVIGLPKSYQEAILVCLKLNILFLWIDSLCIFQDSKEDWERESITMQDVYGSSYLNICTAAAANSTEESFVGRSIGVLKTPRISTTWDKSSKEGFYLLYDHALYEDITKSPLRYRAWVYQEWYLSPRSLILSHNLLWWHCRGTQRSEAIRNGLEAYGGFSGFKPAGVGCPKPTGSDRGVSQSFRPWFEHVRAYMKMDLTKESDRVVAFSGVVSSFGLSQGLTGTYLAGLWRAHLPAGLCWYVLRSKTSRSRSSRYAAPSWTWTSIHGPYQLAPPTQPLGDGLLATLESAPDILPDDCSNLGFVLDGAITIRGDIVGPVSLVASENSAYVADKHNGDKQAQVYFDENDDKGPLITNMSSLPSGKGQSGSRQVERLKDHTGSFFLLPIADIPWMHVVFGLVLYRTQHDSSVFSRLGLFRCDGFPEGRFKFKVTNKSVAGTLVTIV